MRRFSSRPSRRRRRRRRLVQHGVVQVGVERLALGGSCGLRPPFSSTSSSDLWMGSTSAAPWPMAASQASSTGAGRSRAARRPARRWRRGPWRPASCSCRSRPSPAAGRRGTRRRSATSALAGPAGRAGTSPRASSTIALGIGQLGRRQVDVVGCREGVLAHRRRGSVGAGRPLVWRHRVGHHFSRSSTISASTTSSSSGAEAAGPGRRRRSPSPASRRRRPAGRAWW